MKHLTAILLAVLCLTSACRGGQTTSPQPLTQAAVDSAAIYQEKAYQAMFDNVLHQAEQHAYRAFLLSSDSAFQADALSLLCYIYYREGKEEEMQMLMQTISPALYTNVMDVQSKVEQAKAGKQRHTFAIIVLLLLLALGAVAYWYVHRMKALSRLYQQRIDKVRESLPTSIPSQPTPIPSLEGREQAPEYEKIGIGDAKTGIDVLFAIINDQNISQMGKYEEQAVLKTLPLIDATLSDLLSQATATLTPKETFFCIMEYFGKSDRQKSHSFCCSEQAIRSTKSRLNKKIDISVFHLDGK